MKKTLIPMACLVAVALTLSSQSASAGIILQYDSTGDASNQLSVIASETDNSLVSAADSLTSIDGNGTILAGPHPSQTNVAGAFATANDLHFRMGGNSSTLSYTLAPANVGTGSWVGTSFTAAQNMTLDEFSFHLFVNSQSGSLFAARDVGLFASLDSGATFTQFGALRNGTNTGNQGIVTFTDTLAIGSGQTADLRLLFTDKTSSANNLQASTRVGDIMISGVVAVPEPSSFALLGLAGLGFTRRRRKA